MYTSYSDVRMQPLEPYIQENSPFNDVQHTEPAGTKKRLTTLIMLTSRAEISRIRIY